MAEVTGNPNENVVEEEEEEQNQGSDARQDLDDLTVLTDSTSALDDAETQDAGSDATEWEEPAASQSLSTIHTGSRPTDAELIANLVPEGETIIEEGEIVRPEEQVGEELEEIAAGIDDLDVREREGEGAVAEGDGLVQPQAQAQQGPELAEAPETVEAEQRVAAGDDPTLVADPTVVEVAPPVTEAPTTTAPPTTTEAPEDTPEPTLEPEATAAPLEVEDTAGTEDTAIALDIEPQVGANIITIADVPEGAVLSAGTDNGDGTWTLAVEDLDGLTIMPPADSDADFTLIVSDGTTTSPLNVVVAADADAPTATAQDATGDEDTAIALDLTSQLSDVDGSESLSITLSGVPDGATLSAGTDNGDGTWTLSSADLSGLTITPPADFNGDIQLSMTATSTEADGGDSESTSVDFTVTVDNTVDFATDSLTTAEDTAVSLSIDMAGNAEVVLSDIPDGATLTYVDGNGATQTISVTDGAATLTADQMNGLSILPPADSADDFSLTVTAGGHSDTLPVEVTAVADVPTVSASDAAGQENTVIPIEVSSALTDVDGSETLSVLIAGVPSGATLSAGTDNGNGTWTLTADDLTGLTVTPATDYTGTFNLTMTATATEAEVDDQGEHSTAENTIVFNVTVNEEGQFATTASVGDEDTAIALNIDPGDATEVTISNIPNGAVLSAGTDNGDGTFTVSVADLSNLTITPPADSDADFTLAISAAGESDLTLPVTVNAVADTPTAAAQDATGVEDTAIALDLTSNLADADGSETLSITIGGMPEGATLSAGTDNGDGTWTLTGADLNGLTVTPPANFFGDIPLTMTSTSTEADGGDTATTSTNFTVSVSSDGDFGSGAVTGLEDTAIPLPIETGTLDVTELELGNIPDGAVLTYVDGDGVTQQLEVVEGNVTVTTDQLNGLAITPPANTDADFSLTVTAGGITENLAVTVTAVADTPTATAQDVTGTEDTQIPLDLASALTDLDGSESLSITISGVPDGAVFSVGTDNGDGTWSIPAGDLEGLTIRPPLNFEGDLSLSMTATATEAEGGDTSTVTVPFTVTVEPDLTEPDLQAGAVEGYEDTAIVLNIDPGSAESLTVVGLPEGATLSAGTDNGNGTWTVQAADVPGLTVTPPENSDVDFTLTVSGEINGVVQSQDVGVTVHAVADRPDLDVTSSIGDEDTAIPLNISSSLVDADGSETLALTVDIVGIPEGATLSYTDGDGATQSVTVSGNSANLTPEQLNGLTITPPQDYFGDITLQVTSTATELDGNDSAATTASFGVTVRPVLDIPDVTAVNVSGDEDTGIALDISASMPADTTVGLQSVLLGGIESGSTLTYVDGDGATQTITYSGTVAQLTPDQLNGLTVTPPADFNGTMNMTATAFSEDGGVNVSPFTVDVAAIADLAVTDTASGLEDTAISLDITTAADETVTISDVPTGATLSAGTDNGDGTWTLSADQLDGLTITPPADSDADFTLTVTAAEMTETIGVSVAADADAPTLDLTAAAGTEDTAVPLTINTGLTDTDGSETLSITISGVPSGASLSAGTDNGDGSWTLSSADLTGLTITPPADSDVDFSLTVAATTTEADGGDTATTTGTLDVSLTGDADAPTLDLTATAAGTEDTAISLDIAAGLTDASESLSVTISGVPTGASLSAGTDNGDGTWTLSSSDLSGLTVTPPADSDADFQLTVTATSTDGADTASTVGTIDVSVAADADAPTLVVSDASGSEDNSIALNIDPGLTDLDGSETLSISVSNIPDGAVLVSDGQPITVTNGTAQLTEAQLTNLSITPPADFNGTFDLSVTATATEADGGDTATTSGTISVDVAAVADAATVTTADAAGLEDAAIGINIGVDSVDTVESVVISGVPNGASLSAGTDNGDGTWTLSSGDLTGLTVTPPANSDADFTLTVTATTADGGDTQVVTGELDVSVTGVADQPALATVDASGTEDSAITLNINTGLVDMDGSETLSVSIANIPDGAVLMSGGTAITVTDGAAQLTPAQLSNLTITPPADSSEDFQLSVTATSTEASGDTATTSGTLNVNVAGDADTPTLDLTAAAGLEDTAIPLTINAGLTDATETLSVTLGNFPSGASLSYVDGDGATQAITFTGNSVSLTAEQLNGLAVTPPADSNQDFQLTVTATSTDESDTASVSGSLAVNVTGDADAPTLDLTAASGTEDTAIPLNINAGLSDTDGSETLSAITVSDVPAGAELSAGTDNGDGTWTLSAADLDGLTITPPANSDVDFQLTVSVTATENDGDTATTTGTLDVSVAPDADTPTLDFTAFAGGMEDQAIALNINAGSADADETLSVTISGVPTGASLSAGTDNGDGTWTLSGPQLDGLTITPPANSDVDFQLSVTATTTDGSDTATTSGTINVAVFADADAPTLDLTAAGGDEGTAIPLTIDTALVDTDGSETLSISISNIPDGAVLTSGGTAITITNGTAELTETQLTNLTVTPPPGSDADFSLLVSATAMETDGGDTSTVSGILPVSVNDTTQTPTLTLDDSAGTEDTSIPLSIDTGSISVDTITITGMPTGATLSAGTDNGDGTWSLDAGDLAGLTVTPPADSDVDFQLTVDVTATDGGAFSGAVDVTVAADADAPTLDVTAASGTEDAAIPLNITAGLTDTDGSETLSAITISDVPTGASLSAGTDNGDGTWTLTSNDLNGLTITPSADSSADFSLTVTATSTDGSDTATTSGTLNVSVAADADAPTLDLSAASGTEDTAIPLNITAGLTDTDGSETLSAITISDVPTGASLSAGTDNGDGTWTLTSNDLNGLTITPPADSSADFSLTVSVSSTETDGGDTATTTGTLNVSVAADADAPTLDLTAASGTEDQAIALDITAGLTDASESLSVTISGVPSGAGLSAGTDNGDGTWTLDSGDLSGLTITPPADSDADFALTVTATSTDGTDTATTSGTLNVSVAADADAPTLDLTAASGDEDTAIPLNITAGLTDTDGSETLSAVTISGVPAGASLSAGTDNGDGSWTLSSNDLNGLTVTPPADSDADFSLSVSVSSTEADGGDTATTTGTLNVSVGADADAPTLDLTAASGTEDQAIALDITAGLTDASETLSVTISGVPSGASLSAGTDNGDGSWTLEPGDLSSLTITPPADSDADFALTVTATSTDGTDTATTSGTLNVSVAADADAPTLDLTAASGTEDQAIALDINAGLTDTDGSESLSVTISGVPSGASLSAGTDNGDGTWTLTSDDLNGLTITPSADSDADFSLSVSATSTEADGGDTATTTGTLNVSVAADADAPTLDLTAASGAEDQAIALDITAGLTDASESLSVTISGVPSGASLSAGTDNGDGTWTLEPGDLSGLTITPPADSDADFSLTVTATSTDGTDTATTSGTLNVSVAADADAPTLDLTTVSGNEDSAIALDISSGLTDTDGSESLSVTVSGVPSGASLSAGTDNGDGSWTLDSGDLDGLTITPPADYFGSFDLSVSATSTEADGGDTATVSGTMTVNVADMAETPVLTLTESSGDEDTAIALNIDTSAGGEINSIVISDVPTGASLSAGTDNGDGTWTLSNDDLDGLTVTPPANSDVDFTLSVEATGVDGSTVSGSVDVEVEHVADAATLDVSDASGTEDQAIALNIDAGLTDLDGSELNASTGLSITISDVPAGASLNAGTDNGDGSWTLTADDLSGLTITPPSDSDADFALSVTAAATDGGDTTLTTGTLNVSVAADADAPTLDLTAASGTEDTAISLDITAGLTDTDGSESLSVTISGVPSGAGLSAGTDNGDGTWTLESGDLSGLTITPPADSDADFSLTVTATSTDGTDTATTSGTLNVSVAADADAPTLDLTAASGTEDQAIALDIDTGLTDTDGSESLSVTISGVPSGASLSAGTDNGDGSWTLTSDDLDGLTVTPPADSDADFSLTVTATATDGSDTATTTGTLDVSVAADADAPTLDLTAASGTEDQAIALDIDTGLTDTDGSESLSVTISGVPSGASLSAGTDNGDGTWTLEPGDLSGLTVTPPADSDADFSLTVTATATDGSDTATTSGTLDVSVAADADAPTLDLAAASGTEDTAIPLNISAGLTDTDGSETLSAITISDVPAGANLSAGTDNGDGTWTLSSNDLNELTITPPADSDADFSLTVSVSSTDGSDTATTTGTLDVSVAADADAPTLDLTAASGTEDQAIALDIDAGLTDADGSESLSVTISGVPSGAALSVGTDNGDGTWTLESGDLDGLTITPPADSDADFSLTVTATSTDGTDTATTSGTLNVSVAADADAPTLDLTAASGTEDQAIALDITAGLTDASESLSVTISGVPSGANLSAGTDNGDGTWTLESGDLDGLTVTPPADSDADFSLTVTATSTDGSDTATTSGTLNVSVAADADAPTLDLTTASGDEDTAIALNITSGLTDADGSESLSVTISGVPSGASLSAGTDNGDGSWTLESGDLSGLTITPPTDYAGSFDLSVTATATEGTDGDTATTSGTMTVNVADVADAVDLTLSDSSGVEDNAIALNIDTSGAAADSITISGVPSGATLSAGTDNGDGTWTLTEAQVDGVTITPPENSDADFTLTVTATTADGTESTGTVDVTVTGDADAPTLSADSSYNGETGVETGIDVPTAISDAATGDTTVTVSGVPSGATLSAGTDNGDGTWTLDSGDLSGLTFSPADGSTDTASLSFEVTGDGEPGETLTSEDFSGGVSGWSGDAYGSAGQMVLQGDASASKTFDFGSEHAGQTVTISFDHDAGSGWEESGSYTDYFTVSANGTEVVDTTDADSATQSFTVTLDQNGQVTLEMSTDTTASSEHMHIDNLQITSGDDWETSLASASVDVEPDTGLVYDLDITSALTDTDGSETLSIVVGDLPSGAELSAGTNNGDGTWTLEAGDLDGLTVTVPDGSGDFNVAVSATATEADGDTNTVSTTVSMTEPDLTADGATLNVSDTSGSEDQAISLDIGATLADTDGSETVSITVSGVPSGASLSAGTDNGDGSWTLESGDLSGLTITPPADSDADFSLTVSATTTESASGDTATTTSTLNVTVDGVADAPTLSADSAYNSQSGAETSIDVPTSISDAATGDTSVTVSGVPSGATLSAGTDNGDGTWTLSSGDLSGLSFTPADGSTDTASLSFEVTGEGGAGESLFTDNFNSGVSGWGDEVGEEYGSMYIGWEATDESATRTFDFGSEHGGQTVTISFDTEAWSGWDESGSYQDYLRVSANGSEVYTSSEGDATTHTMTVTLDGNGQIDLDIMADTTASSEGFWLDNFSIVSGDDWESSLASASVDVEPDTNIVYDLDITSALTDTDGSETLSIVVGDLPTGAVLSAGTDNGDGTWTLESGDLSNLTVTVPDGSGDFNVAVSATATESDGDTNTVSTTVSVTEPDLVVEGATLNVSDASGSEDRAISLDIGATLADTDGSESVSITVSGVPSGASLSAGTDNGDGSWTLEQGDLSGLTIQPPSDSDTDFSLTVTATTTESTTGETSTTSSSMNVTVDGVADAPALSASVGSGTAASSGNTPVGYWNVDETSGSTFYDSVGDNDGAMHGYFDNDDSGVYGTAAEFRPGYSDEYIEVSGSEELHPDSGALTMWFNADNVGGGEGGGTFALASSDSSGYDDGGHFRLNIEDGTLSLRMQDENSQTTISGGSVSTGDWNQVTVTWGDDGANIYLNGTLVASDPDWTTGLAGNENPWTFGADQAYSGNNTADDLRNFFDGHMDDIAIYDTQLDASAVSNLYDDGVQTVMDDDSGGGMQFPLNITASLSDSSETLSISLDGLPDGATLSAGTDNGDGTWSVDSGDLDGLTMTVPEGSDDFVLNVAATSTDGSSTSTTTNLIQVDVGADGFDGGTTGTSSADSITGTSSDDVISGEGGADTINAGAGDDTILGGAGDDVIDGGDGADVIDGGDGADTIDSGAGNDIVDGGDGNDIVDGGDGDDLFIFGAGDGSDYFQGGDGWSDTVQIEGVDSGPGGADGWTLQVDDGVGYTQTEDGVEFDAEASGSIVLNDGSELTFENVEKLEW